MMVGNISYIDYPMLELTSVHAWSTSCLLTFYCSDWFLLIFKLFLHHSWGHLYVMVQNNHKQNNDHMSTHSQQSIQQITTSKIPASRQLSYVTAFQSGFKLSWILWAAGSNGLAKKFWYCFYAITYLLAVIS